MPSWGGLGAMRLQGPLRHRSRSMTYSSAAAQKTCICVCVCVCGRRGKVLKLFCFKFYCLVGRWSGRVQA